MLPSLAWAWNGQSGDNIIVTSEQSIDGNYYAAGQSVEIYGRVNGDVFAAGQNIIIDSPEINGSLFLAGNSIEIRGVVTGSIHVAGQNLNLAGSNKGNVLGFGQNFVLNKDAQIGGHLTFFGQSASLRGQVGGKLEGAMDSLSISGKINKDVDVYVGEAEKSGGLQVVDGAQVGGNLKYASFKKGSIASGAVIGGQSIYNQVFPQKNKKPFFTAHRGQSAVYEFFVIMVIGMLLIYLWPNFMKRIYEKAKKQPGRSFLRGLLVLIVTPIAALILAITIIGAPLALIMLILWAILLYVVRILAAWLLGNWLKDNFFAKKNWSNLIILGLGTIVYLLVGLVPFLGALLCAIIYIIAWGTLTEIKYKE